MSPPDRGRAARTFPSTHWSQVRAAGKLDEAAGRNALGELLLRYEPALLAYAILKFGSSEDHARDLFHGFVQESVLKRDLITNARPMPGCQFRSYLLHAWHTHIQSEYRRQSARKRRPAGNLSPLPEDPDDLPVEGQPPAPELFDLRWAQQVITEASRRMHAECMASHRPDVWGVFEARIHGPILNGDARMPYDQLVSRFGLESPIQARNLLVTGKRMFVRNLERVVSEYASGEGAVEAELRELHIILDQAP